MYLYHSLTVIINTNEEPFITFKYFDKSKKNFIENYDFVENLFYVKMAIYPSFFFFSPMLLKTLGNFRF